MEKATYDAENKIVNCKISGNPSLDEFKETANSALHLIKKHKAKKMLNNIEELEVNSVENQEWTQNVWFPQAYEAGLTWFAFVMPDNIFGEVSARQTNEIAERNGDIVIEYFDSYSNALEWLKGQK